MAKAPDFESIVAEYGPLITRIAQTYEADPSQRQDVVQQILLAVWQALPNWRGEASLKTFVTRIAQNRAISHVAKAARQPRVAELSPDLAAAEPSPEESLNEASERRLLIEATRKLPLPQRDVVVLILEGFSYPEIAEMLGIEANALALRLSRAKAALKAVLEKKP